MKLSFHQHIALFWMIGAPGVFMRLDRKSVV